MWEKDKSQKWFTVPVFTVVYVKNGCEMHGKQQTDQQKSYTLSALK